MVPSIITDESTGDVQFIGGASGGPKIITSTAFVAMHSLWFKLNIKEAIDAKRLHHQLLPMKITHDPGVDHHILKYLSKVGHKLYQLPPDKRGSVVQGISIHDGIITANFDSRKSGSVSGF